MNATQFAWVYLIENGRANMEPSFYGGYDPVDAKAPGAVEKNWYKNWDDAFKKEIMRFGVDWKKTQAPRSESYSQFTDTFHDPEYKEFLTGELVLKNGQKQFWAADPLTMGVFEAMAAIDEYKAKGVELFGEDVA